MKQIGILNYEGNVLTLIKVSDTVFQFQDEWKNPILNCGYQTVLAFLLGEISLYDRKKRAWNYAVAHADAKTSNQQILNFITE